MIRTTAGLAAMLDHAVLGPGKTLRDLQAGVEVATRHQVASLCCNPGLFGEACRLLAGSPVKPSTVIDFPQGASSTTVRLAMIDAALAEAAGQIVELDIVAPQGLVAAGDWDGVTGDLAALIERAHSARALVKVIFENCYRTPDQIVRLCGICVDLRAQFVKSSTGFGFVKERKGMVGALLPDLKLMRETVLGNAGVKASGGLQTFDQLLELLPYCDRFGLSATEAILAEAASRFGS